MGTIVVGVDGSDESRAALQWSLEEGHLRGVEVTALHVWQYPPDLVWQFPPSTLAAEGSPIPDRELFEKRAKDLLRGIVNEVAPAGASADVKQEVVEGSVADRLVEAAQGAELLVVGSRGRGGFRGLLLGSVSQQCAHHTPSPLAIVRRAEGERGIGSTAIVVGVDGSTQAEAALEWAFEEAARRGEHVIALHAYWLPHAHELAFAAARALRDSLESNARTLLHDAVARAGRRGVKCTEVVEEGPPASLLVEAAKRAQLLVVGSRGRGGFRGLLLGSVSQQCAHHAVCPTVIVPPSADGRD